MVLRILSVVALLLPGLAVSFSARAALIESAQETLTAANGLATTVPAMIDGDDIARAQDTLTEARKRTTEYLQEVTAIQSNAENLSQPLGAAWEDAVETAQGLDTMVATALADTGRADMDEVLQAFDGARNDLNTAITFSQNFGRQLLAFRDQQVGGMQATYAGDMTRLQSTLNTALTSRPRDLPGAGASTIAISGLVDAMARNLGTYTTSAGQFGSEVGNRWTPVTNTVPAFLSALHDLQEVIEAKTPFDSEFTAEKTGFQNLGTSLSDAINGIAASQNRFILICDSVCR